MTPSERQTRFIARYSILPDAHERLAALASRKTTLPPLAPEERTDERRVPGCVSRVWLVSSLEDGRCRFRIDADSAMVKGLVQALCELYDDALPADVAATEPEFLEALGLSRNLTPTRLNGLAAVRARIREFALGLPPGSARVPRAG